MQYWHSCLASEGSICWVVYQYRINKTQRVPYSLFIIQPGIFLQFKLHKSAYLIIPRIWCHETNLLCFFKLCWKQNWCELYSLYISGSQPRFREPRAAPKHALWCPQQSWNKALIFCVTDFVLKNDKTCQLTCAKNFLLWLSNKILDLDLADISEKVENHCSISCWKLDGPIDCKRWSTKFWLPLENDVFGLVT